MQQQQIDAAMEALADAIGLSVLKLLEDHGEVTLDDVEQLARRLRAAGWFDELDRQLPATKREPKPRIEGGEGP